MNAKGAVKRRFVMDVFKYNPSVSVNLDSSPYTGEPFGCVCAKKSPPCATGRGAERPRCGMKRGGSAGRTGSRRKPWRRAGSARRHLCNEAKRSGWYAREACDLPLERSEAEWMGDALRPCETIGWILRSKRREGCSKGLNRVPLFYLSSSTARNIPTKTVQATNHPTFR